MMEDVGHRATHVGSKGGALKSITRCEPKGRGPDLSQAQEGAEAGAPGEPPSSYLATPGHPEVKGKEGQRANTSLVSWS